jgi:CheY-like chemotaxis protein
MTRTILLADDSLTIQKVVELTFADTEYNVVAQSSGEDLLQRLPEVRPDLVICDIIMPGKDGYEVCQEIKSDPASLHIPVILLSGTFEPFDRDRALAAGCSEIITKPFEARKLVDCVERLLQGEVEERATAEVPAVSPDATVEVELPAEVPAQQEPPPESEAEPVAAPAFDTPAAEDVAMEEASIDDAAYNENALEFTDTGFADMEAAAGEVAPADSSGDLADDALEFEFSDEHEAFGEPDEPAAEQPEYSAPTDEPPTEPDFSVEVAAPSAPDDLEVGTPAEPFPEPGDETGPPVADSTSPFASPAADPAAPATGVEESELPPTTLPGEELPSPAEPEPVDAFESQPVEVVEPYSEPVAEDIPEETFEGAPQLEAEPVAPPAPIDEPIAIEGSIGEQAPAVVEPEPQVTEADTGPVEAYELDPSTETGPVEAEEAPPAHDTGEVVSPPVVEAAAAVQTSLDTATQQSGLSDDDVERIARRLLELASDRIERIAWEVVPDMAEVVVRQRIRELESEADQQPPEPVQ